MAAVQADRDALAVAPSPAVIPVLVIKNVTDDEDELLFQPESPPSSRTSSVGTPPTPEPSKFVWPAREQDQAIEKREADHTNALVEYDLVTHSKLKDADCGAAQSAPYAASEVATSPDRSFSIMSTIGEDGDHEERVATVLRGSTMPPSRDPSRQLTTQAVKEKIQNVITNQRRETSLRFQLKGGLVGWLHGEGGSNNLDQADGTRDHGVQPSTRQPIDAASAAQPRARASALLGSLRDKMKQTQEQLELKLQALEASSVVGHHATYSEAHSRPSHQPRLSLQPTSRRPLGLDGETSVDFDDFVSTMSAESPNRSQPPARPFQRRDTRLRSASSNDGLEKPSLEAVKKDVRSRLRSLSLASRTARTRFPGAETVNSGLSSSALQWDVFPVEECLADPKLAAEFINTVMPGDEWLLALLYSIEEYEALASTTTTSANDATASLDVQITMATTIIDRFLTSPTCAKYSELEGMGAAVQCVVCQYQLPCEASTAVVQPEGIAALIAAQGATLPTNLFDAVYTRVFDMLRRAYDSKFRLTREHTQMLSHMKQQQEQLGDEQTLQHLMLTFDQVVESEWCCAVFWVYLFRTSHHHRLSFILDVKFKLRRLHLVTQQIGEVSSPEALHANRLLQHEILLICRRFLDSKLAPLALPTTSSMLLRLKNELLGDAAVLEKAIVPDCDLMQRMIEKLDAMRMQTRADFKRMSFERFASFLTSALYRDFIVHPGSAQSTHCTRADDLTHLLRNNRIPFHQTAVSPPGARHLSELRAAEGGVFDKAVATVFAFRGDLDSGCGGAEGLQFSYRSLHVSAFEEDASGQSLQKRVECFLVPDGINVTHVTATDAAKLSPVCFNFLAGTGDSTLYGALWRFGASDPHTVDGQSGVESKTNSYVQGVCILSRYPLVDALTEYLRSLASASASEASCACNVLAMFGADSTGVLATARGAFETHCARLLNRSPSIPPSELIDLSFQDLFECLSIANIMRLFSLMLQEKKIVLVSMSYSVLLSVGETLRAIMSPLVWSHIYVPVLPIAMKGCLHCPTPFIFGLHSSYVRQCELPKPSDDFVIMNLDRDSVTGGGDVFLPPLRANALREKLTALCKPRLRARDSIRFIPNQPTGPFPSTDVRHVFQRELLDILRHLETFAFRFECADRAVSVVDTSNKSRQWPADAARFYSAILQSQAFSTFLGRTTAI
jgi:hypothetical protein